MAISQIVLIVLAIGMLVQLIYQFRLRESEPALGKWVALANLSVMIAALVGNESALFSSSGPPPKFDLPNHADHTPEAIRTCVTTISLSSNFSSAITPHSRGGYWVEIVGKGLMLSKERQGLWERVGFFLDIEPRDRTLRVQYVGLQGKSTYSNSAQIPPLGERWEPFNDQEMARYNFRMDGISTHISKCMESLGVSQR